MCEKALGRNGSYFDVAGLLHESSSIFSCSVAFGELNPEKLKSTLKVSLKKVLLRGLHSEKERERDDEYFRKTVVKRQKGCQ